MSSNDSSMAGNILKPLDDQVNRNAKDSVFCDLFAQPEYLLQMYAVLHPEDDVTSIKDITLVTLDHKLLNAQYNDLGFIVGNRLMILVEHQSTWTVNILIRFLMYLGETYQRYIRNNHINIYGTRTIELPKPELYVIYPGERGNRPDEISLSRDVFHLGNDAPGFVDVRAKIIYNSRHGDIIDQYITFCRIFDRQIRLYGKTEKAVRESLRICRDRDILREYLAKEEVPELMFGYFNMEEQLEFIREEAREEARAEARAKGLAEGRAEGRAEGAALFASLISKLLSMGRSADVERAAKDNDYRERLYKEFQMV